MLQVGHLIPKLGILSPTLNQRYITNPNNLHSYKWNPWKLPYIRMVWFPQNGKFNDSWSIPTFSFVCHFSFLEFAHVPLQQWKGSAAWRSKGVMRPGKGLYCGMFSFRFLSRGGFFSKMRKGSLRKPKFLHIFFDQLWVTLTYLVQRRNFIHLICWCHTKYLESFWDHLLWFCNRKIIAFSLTFSP